MPTPAIWPNSETPAVIGRQERQKSGGYGGAGERQRHADFFCRARERRPQLWNIVTFGAVANRKLNGEIDAQADKQNRKGDRNHIQRADHHKPERGGDRQSRRTD